LRFGLDLLNCIKPASFHLQFHFWKFEQVTGWQIKGWQPFFVSPEISGWGRKCETERCHGEAARSVLVKVRVDLFSRFYTVAAKRRSRTRNSQFGLNDRCFALPQLLYRWQHKSGIFWIPPRSSKAVPVIETTPSPHICSPPSLVRTLGEPHAIRKV
jgi:hypothetical protein